MKKLLWLSRHHPNEDQIKILEKKVSEVFVHTERVESISEILELMKLHDTTEIMAVVSWELLKELVRRDMKPIKAVMTGKNQFDYFEKIVKLETQRWE